MDPEVLAADGSARHTLHTDFDTACAGQFEPGMVVCVESLVGEAGSECVKLETQVLVTETGNRRLDSFPWEEA